MKRMSTWEHEQPTPLALFALGMAEALPVATSIFLSFSVVGGALYAVQFTQAQVMTFVATTFAAPAQLIAGDMLAAGTPVGTVVLVIALINARFVFMSLATARALKGVSPWRLLPWLGMLSAVSFALSSTRFREQEAWHTAQREAYLAGVCLLVFVCGMLGACMGPTLTGLGSEGLLTTGIAVLLALRVARVPSPPGRMLVLLVFLADPLMRLISPAWGSLILVLAAAVVVTCTRGRKHEVT